MRLPSIPGPRDVLGAAERAGGLIEQLAAAVPRVSELIGGAETLLTDVHGLLERIEATRAGADEVIRRTSETVTRADLLLGRLEPSLTTLQPTLERLAETTDPREVDALVTLVDQLPVLALQVERDVIPVLTTLGSVAPDLHDLLDVSRELNEMLAKLPGLSRIRRRVDQQQAADG